MFSQTDQLAAFSMEMLILYYSKKRSIKLKASVWWQKPRYACVLKWIFLPFNPLLFRNNAHFWPFLNLKSLESIVVENATGRDGFVLIVEADKRQRARIFHTVFFWR
jgi:hypothetical protein